MNSHYNNITAVYVTYNSSHVIIDSISELCKYLNNIIVVDNSSTDDTVTLLKKFQCKIVQLNENIGFGAANNIAAKECVTDYILFINPDCVFNEKSFEVFFNLLKATQFDVLAPRIFELNSKELMREKTLLSSKRNKDNLVIKNDHTCQYEFISGACFLIKTDVFHEVGGFDPNIFLFYEDDDLFKKLTLKNKIILKSNNVIVNHIRGGSSTNVNRKTFFLRYHQAWSKSYIEKKYNLKSSVVSQIIYFSLKLLLTIIIFNFKKIDRYLGTICGHIDFLMGVRNLPKKIVFQNNIYN